MARYPFGAGRLGMVVPSLGKKSRRRAAWSEPRDSERDTVSSLSCPPKMAASFTKARSRTEGWAVSWELNQVGVPGVLRQ